MARAVRLDAISPHSANHLTALTARSCTVSGRLATPDRSEELLRVGRGSLPFSRSDWRTV